MSFLGKNINSNPAHSVIGLSVQKLQKLVHGHPERCLSNITCDMNKISKDFP